jgi:hypothetical protein
VIDLDTLLSTGLTGTSPDTVVLCLLTAFVLGKVISVTYQQTYEGLSYSRGFVQVLVLGPVVATILMMAIGDNLARGLGILGTMALVRFRTNVRDSRDMIFIFAGLAIGVASGVQAFAVALLGTIGFCLSAFAVDWTPFGRRQRFDGIVRFWLPRDGVGGEGIRAILSPHCRSFVLVALRDFAQGETLEYAYQVKLKNPDSQEHLVQALSALPDIGGLTLLLQDAHTEI